VSACLVVARPWSAPSAEPTAPLHLNAIPHVTSRRSTQPHPPPLNPTRSPSAGSHNDTYAESFHRDFFANWARGVAPELCAKGTEGHNTAQIGGFVMLPPVIMANLGAGREAARRAALTQLGLTHDSTKLAAFASEYAGLLYDLATGVSGWGHYSCLWRVFFWRGKQGSAFNLHCQALKITYPHLQRHRTATGHRPPDRRGGGSQASAR